VTEVLSAVGFVFLKSPVSAAMAVDMPAIDIEAAKITARHTLKSTIQGNIDIEASCPAYSETVYYKNAFTQLSAVAAAQARVEAVMGGSLFTGSLTRLKRSTELLATERSVVQGIGEKSETWRSQVGTGEQAAERSQHAQACTPACMRSPAAEVSWATD
jgi:hypothetical protein